MPGPGTSAIASERMYIPPLSQVCPRGHTTALGATPIGGPPDRIQRPSSTGGTGEDVSCSAGAITADVSGSSYAHPAIPPRRHRNRRWMHHYRAGTVRDRHPGTETCHLPRGCHRRSRRPREPNLTHPRPPHPRMRMDPCPQQTRSLHRSPSSAHNSPTPTGQGPPQANFAQQPTQHDAAIRHRNATPASAEQGRAALAQIRIRSVNHRHGRNPQSASAPDPGGSNTGSGAHLQHAPPFRSPARPHPPMQGVRDLPGSPVCARRRMRRSARMRGSRRQERPFAPPRRWRPVNREGDRIVRRRPSLQDRKSVV